jgi:hypothetical protein
MLKSSLEHGSRLKRICTQTNATASPTIKSPAYLDVSNFSVEFCFKGNNGTSQATLLSNGRGDSQDKKI